jgi:hypothetical protein
MRVPLHPRTKAWRLGSPIFAAEKILSWFGFAMGRKTANAALPHRWRLSTALQASAVSRQSLGIHNIFLKRRSLS